MAENGILVTRPEGQAAELSALLLEAGYRPLCLPLVVIQGVAEPDVRQRGMLLELDSFDAVIFISSNAVRFGMDWIEDFWPQLPHGLEWYTVGEGSAVRLAEHGLEVSYPRDSMNSEGLLELLGRSGIKGRRFLIVKGEGGREFLRKSLQDSGAVVEELAAYQRQAPALTGGDFLAQLRQGHCSGILISSGAGLNNMVSLLGESELDAVRELLLVVPAERVAEEAKRLGFGNVEVAENATDHAMFECLKRALPARVEGR